MSRAARNRSGRRRAGEASSLRCSIDSGAKWRQAPSTPLDRLEQKGLISSELEAGTAVRAGRPRRCYAIAPAGVRALNDAKAASERLYAGMRWPLRSPR